MIPVTDRQKNVPRWQRELTDAVRDPNELCRLLEIDPGQLGGLAGDTRSFPLRVPRAFVSRMRPRDPNDPLLRQVLPIAAEQDEVPGFGPDPVGDQDAMDTPGVLHKYHGRALLTVTGACAVHCRYCFRREFPYAEANPRRDDWAPALERIAADPGIREVILSGGDPLSLKDGTLADLANRLAAIDHVDTLRLHTRLPIVLPARVDSNLTDWLQASRLQTVIVVHANHGNEIDQPTTAALAALRGASHALLNQTVLLRGVNDEPAALVELSRRLFGAGVLPYYLHMLDPVRGAAHFAVDDRRAGELTAAAAARLPGYLVPRLVREVPGAPGKTPLAWHWADA